MYLTKSLLVRARYDDEEEEDDGLQTQERFLNGEEGARPEGVTTLGTLEKDFPALSYVTATSHIGPFKLNHIELKFRSLVTLAIFQVLERYM